MAPVSLKIRVKKDDEIDVEIEDEETVEALAVVIYSIRPELGEEFKLLRTGKILKSETVLSAAGFKTGDLVIIAKVAKPETSSTPVGTPTSSALPSTQVTFDPPTRVDGERQSASTTGSGDLSSSPPAKYPRLEEGSMDVDAPKSEQVANETLEVVQKEQVSAVSEEAPQELPSQPSTSAVPPESVQSSPKPELSTTVESLTLPIAAVADDKTAAPEQNNEQPQPEESATPESTTIEVDASSAAGLMAFATSLENGGPVPSPSKLAELMKDSASRMLVLEGAIKEFGQALQMVNVISATGLRGGMANIGSELGIDSSPKPQAEEGGRSFLIKKGDADLQEAYQKASSSSPMAHTTSGTTGGTSSVPLSKEEMDKARQARLAKLEAMQSEKQKEKNEADEKSRARDAMFSRRGDPTGKPLGKP